MHARLLRRALAQLGGQLVGGGAVGRELGLEHLEAGADDVARGLQRVRQTVGGGLERLVAGQPAALVLEPPRALLALALGAFGEPLLGLERGLDLRAPLGARPLVGRGAALLDDPARVTLGLGGLVAGARGLTRASRSIASRAASASATVGLRGLDLRLRRPLGLGRDLDLLDQRVPPVALGEHAVGAAGRDLAQLARRRATRRARPWSRRRR